MVDDGAIRFLKEILDGNYYAERWKSSARCRPLFRWEATASAAERALLLIRPFLRVKAEQADNVLALRELQRGARQYRTLVTGYYDLIGPNGKPRQVRRLAYSAEYLDMCEALFSRMSILNAVGVR